MLLYCVSTATGDLVSRPTTDITHITRLVSRGTFGTVILDSNVVGHTLNVNQKAVSTEAKALGQSYDKRISLRNALLNAYSIFSDDRTLYHWYGPFETAQGHPDKLARFTSLSLIGFVKDESICEVKQNAITHHYNTLTMDEAFFMENLLPILKRFVPLIKLTKNKHMNWPAHEERIRSILREVSVGARLQITIDACLAACGGSRVAKNMLKEGEMLKGDGAILKNVLRDFIFLERVKSLTYETFKTSRKPSLVLTNDKELSKLIPAYALTQATLLRLLNLPQCDPYSVNIGMPIPSADLDFASHEGKAIYLKLKFELMNKFGRVVGPIPGTQDMVCVPPRN